MDVLPLKTGVCLVAGGWLYGALLGLLLAFIKPEQPLNAKQGNECLLVSFYKVPLALFAATVIGLGTLIVIIQIATYRKLWQRLHTQIGDVSASNHGNIARNKLYKRAMTTCSMIAAAYLFSWLPLMMFVLSIHWSNIDVEKSGNVLRFFGILGIGQAFCNAIIFKLRNTKCAFCTRN